MSTTLAIDQKMNPDVSPVDRSRNGFEAKTILFNDNVHTFEEVAAQLVRAIHCTYSRGMILANAVHMSGSAVVYMGHFERCEAVAMVLEEIGLTVNVQR